MGKNVNTEDRVVKIAKQVILDKEMGDHLIELSDGLLISHLPVYVFAKLIYSLQTAATEEALNTKFRITNPFGPGGE